jgi:hypothetical protein
VIYIRKEFAYVALEHPAGARVILAHDVSERPKAIYRGVRPLPVAAGERVGDERFIEKWIELAIDGMMNKAVPHACLVDITWFRVGYFKRLIPAVTIRPVYQIGAK